LLLAATAAAASASALRLLLLARRGRRGRLCDYGLGLGRALRGRVFLALLAPEELQQMKSPSRARALASPHGGREASLAAPVRRPCGLCPCGRLSARCGYECKTISPSLAAGLVVPGSRSLGRPQLRHPRVDRAEPLREAGPRPGLHLLVAHLRLGAGGFQVLEPSVRPFRHQQPFRLRRGGPPPPPRHA